MHKERLKCMLFVLVFGTLWQQTGCYRRKTVSSENLIEVQLSERHKRRTNTENQNVKPYAANQANSQASIQDLLDRVEAISDATSRKNLTFPHEPTKSKYFSHKNLTEFLHKMADKFKTITRLYSVGKSVSGRDIWAMEISDNPGVHEPGEPEFQYTANMHGNEIVGRTVTLNLISLLCENYGVDPLLTSLVNFTRIHLIPTMNPDGFSRALNAESDSDIEERQYRYGRTNDHDVDLNRNFPYANNRTYAKAEPETKAIIDWLLTHPFVLAGDLHGGNLVADYPFDFDSSGGYHYSATPDDEAFKWLAESYSKWHRVQQRISLNKLCKICLVINLQAHPVMHTGHPDHCPQKEGDFFQNGILNGATYYGHRGAMEDWLYLHTSCMQIAVELGCTKFVDANDLPKYWEDNKYSLLVFIAQIHKGIKGFVTDAQSGEEVPEVDILVANTDVKQNNTHVVKSAQYGDYWRLLPPGSYMITAQKTGYISSKQNVKVTDGAATIVNLQITDTRQPTSALTNPKFITALVLSIVVFLMLVVGVIILLRVLIKRRSHTRMVSLVELPQYHSKWPSFCANCNPCCRKKQRDISLADYGAAVRLLAMESEASSEEEFSIPLPHNRTPSELSADEL